MKKIKCLLVLLVISVFLTGCGKSATDSVKKYLDNYKNLDDKVLVDMKNVIDKENLNEENSKKYEDILKKLLDTGNAEIVEATVKENYWGCGPNNDGQNN